MADTDTTGSGEVQEVFMLTTTDNPFNPFTQWNEWFAYDEQLGYHTCALLARVTITSDELSDVDQDLALQQAIDEVVEYNVSGMHQKVSRSSFETE
jgi:hypothetical protein